MHSCIFLTKVFYPQKTNLLEVKFCVLKFHFKIVWTKCVTIFCEKKKKKALQGFLGYLSQIREFAENLSNVHLRYSEFETLTAVNGCVLEGTEEQLYSKKKKRFWLSLKFFKIQNQLIVKLILKDSLGLY